MKKFLTVMMWLGLGICLTLILSLNGEKKALTQERKEAIEKNEALQTAYEKARTEWEDLSLRLTEEKDELTEEKKQLLRRVETLEADLEAAQTEITAHSDAEEQASKALSQARDQWEAQCLALNAEREAASGQLSDVLAMLLAPIPDVTALPADTAEEAPPAEAAAYLRPLPHPARGETRFLTCLEE